MAFKDVNEDVHISRIKPGDTVMIDGDLKTVCKKDLGHDDLLGPTLWGDSHKAGHSKITRVTFGAEIARREAQAERALQAVDPEEPEDTGPGF